MRKLRWLSVIVLATGLVAGCSATPTPDARATETAIAAKVFATQTASVPTPTETPQATVTPMPTPTPEHAYAMTDYQELARNTEKYTGMVLEIWGQVAQVMEDGSEMQLLVNMTESRYSWSDPIYVLYSGPRLLEKDEVKITGRVLGRITYTTVLGAKKTVPALEAIKIEPVKIAY